MTTDLTPLSQLAYGLLGGSRSMAGADYYTRERALDIEHRQMAMLAQYNAYRPKPKSDCIGCGAPGEAHVCSYCKRPA